MLHARSLLAALSVLASFPGLAAPGDAQPVSRSAVEAGRKHAVVVGISAYQLERMRLTAASNDAQRVAAFLQRQDRTGGYDVRLLLDGRASRRAIADALESVKAHAGPNDTVLFYFSGHGIRDDEGEGHLCPADVDPENVEDTGYALSKVKTKIQQTQARQKLILLDCCHSGALGDRLFAKGGGAAWVTQPQLARLTEGTGIAILSSSLAGQRSWEDTGSGGSGLGFFTKYLLRGLEGEADGHWGQEGSGNGDGLVSVTELATFVSYRANQEVLERHGAPQQAELTMHGSGDIYLSLATPVTTRPVAVEFSNITVESHATKVVVSWTTNIATDTRIEYGLTTGYDRSVVDPDQGSTTAHSLALEGLTPDTRYHYRIVATGPDHASRSIADRQVSTAAEPPRPSVAPVVSEPEPEVTGNWYLGSRPDLECRISREDGRVTVTNEGGVTVAASLVSASIEIPGWHLTGSFSSTRNRIRWSNGSFWTRSPERPPITGTWYLSGSRARRCRISIDTGGGLILTNEAGDSTRAFFDGGDRLVAYKWGKLEGRVGADRISWRNGSAWSR